MDELVELGEVEVRKTGVMSDSKTLCYATHLLAKAIRIRKWPEYREYYIEFDLEDGSWASIVLPEDEFKKFVRLLNKVISHA